MEVNHSTTQESAEKLPERTRVALLIDTATSWGTGLIEGVVEYGRKHQWTYFLEPRGKFDEMLLPQGQRVNGVIARVTHQSLVQQLISLKIPAINVSWYRFGEDLIPRCTCDKAGVATLAARYLLAKGFRQFAYCGSSLRPNFSDRLGDAFHKEIESTGFSCSKYFPRYEDYARLTWDEQLVELSKWLLSLPKPVALLAYDDIQAQQVTEACRQSQLSVPHDVAVLGGEHDELSSRISYPSLSSVDKSPCEVGYHAARMLHELMLGKDLLQRTVLIPPKRIITNQSTDTIAVEDDILAAAVTFIRQHYQEQIRVSDILRQIPLSRRALEKKFKKHLGCSPWEEIRRVRVEKAIALLCDTDWSMSKIAGACGFDRQELLTRAFRRELGTTPSTFRKQARLRTDPPNLDS